MGSWALIVMAITSDIKPYCCVSSVIYLLPSHLKASPSISPAALTGGSRSAFIGGHLDETPPRRSGRRRIPTMGFRRTPARICLCHRVESLEDKALGINRSSLGFTPVSPRNAQDLSSIQFYEYLISPCVCAPLKCACVCAPHLRVCHLKYTH